MILNKLKENYLIEFVLINEDVFNQKFYTTYYILRRRNAFYICYIGRSLNNQKMVSINKVLNFNISNDITSLTKLKSFSGMYEDHMSFTFNNVIFRAVRPIDKQSYKIMKESDCFEGKVN